MSLKVAADTAYCTPLRLLLTITAYDTLHACIIYQCEAGQEVTLRSSLALMAMLWLIVTAAMLYVREDWCLSTQEGDCRALRGLLIAGT